MHNLLTHDLSEMNLTCFTCFRKNITSYSSSSHTLFVKKSSVSHCGFLMPFPVVQEPLDQSFCLSSRQTESKVGSPVSLLAACSDAVAEFCC